MTGRQDSPALPVGDHGQPEFLRRGARGVLGAPRPHVRAEHQHRSAGRGEQPSDPVDGLGVDGLRDAGLRGHGRGVDGCLRRAGRLAEQRLQRDVQEDRPPVRSAGQPERLSHGGPYPRGVVFRPGPFRDRGEQRRMIELLETAGAPAVIGCPAAQYHHGGGVEARGGDRTHPVGHPRAGGEHGQTGDAGQPRGRLSGEHRGLLVPDIQQPHRRVRLDRPVVQREHVPAGQGEHRRHPVSTSRGDGPRTPVSRRPRVPRCFLCALAHPATLPTSVENRGDDLNADVRPGRHLGKPEHLIVHDLRPPTGRRSAASFSSTHSSGGLSGTR